MLSSGVFLWKMSRLVVVLSWDLKAAFDKNFVHYLGAEKHWQEGSEELQPNDAPKTLCLLNLVKSGAIGDISFLIVMFILNNEN